MSHKVGITLALLCAVPGSVLLMLSAQTPAVPPQRDAVAEAQQPAPVKVTRPEQKKTPHDTSAVFDPGKAAPSSPVFETQPKAGKVSGFDFARDPLNADRPNQPPEEIMKKEIANKPNVMAAQRNSSKPGTFSSRSSTLGTRWRGASRSRSDRPRGFRQA